MLRGVINYALAKLNSEAVGEERDCLRGRASIATKAAVNWSSVEVP